MFFSLTGSSCYIFLTFLTTFLLFMGFYFCFDTKLLNMFAPVRHWSSVLYFTDWLYLVKTRQNLSRNIVSEISKMNCSSSRRHENWTQEWEKSFFNFFIRAITHALCIETRQLVNLTSQSTQSPSWIIHSAPRPHPVTSGHLRMCREGTSRCLLRCFSTPLWPSSERRRGGTSRATHTEQGWI